MSSLVFVTQLIDPDDPALGFSSSLVAALAAELDHVDVVANEVRGAPPFPSNVRVHSLGKERGAGRLERGWRFERTVARLLSDRDDAALFAHMCPDYLTLATPIAKARLKSAGAWLCEWPCARPCACLCP